MGRGHLQQSPHQHAARGHVARDTALCWLAVQTFEIWKKIVHVILFFEWNLMSPACRPNYAQVARTTKLSGPALMTRDLID
jgi:hypothetical protein